MRSKRTVILALMLLLTAALAGQDASTAGAKPKTVQKRGTVEAGVEAGCLILRDTGDHKLYNVLFVTGKKPAAGEEIRFTGTLDDRPTTCMEGIPVVVTEWKPAKAGKPRPK